MATERAEEGSFRQSTRAPVEAVVRLHFEGALAPESGFSANVSSSGMFVRHTEPREPGSRLTFEFQVGKERLPVLGTGEVVWLRERYEGPGKPPGMGIQFTNLDALSRQNLTMALFEFLEESLSLL